MSNSYARPYDEEPNIEIDEEEQRDKLCDKNKVILEVGCVTKNTVQPWVSRIIIDVYNSVDDVDSFSDHCSEDIPGYMDREEREELLEMLREFIGNEDSGSFPIEKIDKIIMEQS